MYTSIVIIERKSILQHSLVVLVEGIVGSQYYHGLKTANILFSPKMSMLWRRKKGEERMKERKCTKSVNMISLFNSYLLCMFVGKLLKGVEIKQFYLIMCSNLFHCYLKSSTLNQSNAWITVAYCNFSKKAAVFYKQDSEC